MQTLNKFKFESLVLCFVLLIYPLFIRDTLFSLKIQYILNFFFILLAVYGIVRFNLRLTKSGKALLLFSTWMFVVLIIGYLTNFQEQNNELKVPPFFAINTDGELADNYFNQGEIYINVMYIGRMIIFIPLAFFLGTSFKNVENEFISKIIWLFLICSFLSVSYDFFISGNVRSSGLYQNPQDMSAIVLFYSCLYMIVSKGKQTLFLILFLLLSFVTIIMTGTRSSLLVFIILTLLQRKPKLLFLLSLLLTIIISLFLPYYFSIINNIQITSMSSTIVRLKLWGEYLIPRIAENFILGVGTVPVVTENLLLFLLFVFGFIGVFLFIIFIYRLIKYSTKRKDITLIISVIILQSIYFMGLLSLDNIVVTFFVLGLISGCNIKLNNG